MIDCIEPVPRNEQVVLTLLSRERELSKADIADLGAMSWSTAVKMVHRLMTRGMVVVAGKADNPRKPGKKELLYTLSADQPVALGVDVEYSVTRVVLINLRNDILAEEVVETPQHPTSQSLEQFLEKLIESFIQRHVAQRQHLEGVGIGLPGVVIPSWIKPDTNENRLRLERHLQDVLDVRVTIEINVRSYSNYVKWHLPDFAGQDFLLVSVRTGVGMAIVLEGKRFVGHQFISGELGHIKVSDEPLPCRCGGTGCLETVVNQNRLFLQYHEKVLGLPAPPNPDREELEQSLASLFNRAANGDEKARSLVDEAAGYLAKALAPCLMMLYVPRVVLCGHFGAHGDLLIPGIQRGLEQNLLPSMNVHLVYHEFEQDRYAHGAALLVLERYLDFSTVGLNQQISGGVEG